MPLEICGTTRKSEACDMHITDIILLLIIIAYGGYLLTDGLILPLFWGKTLLAVRMRKRNYVDQLILAGLVVIIYIASKVRGDSGGLTGLLLICLALILLYGVLIYAPKARFKENGFYYGLSYTAYDQIKNIKLSEDGVLVIDNGHRRILLYARKMEDLEKILHVLQEH